MGVPLNIDWQQILLHLFNFFILAGGLYILLYKPIKQYMSERQKHFADIDAAAQEKLQAAEAQKQQYADRMKDVDKEISAMKNEAMTAAKKAAAEEIAAAKAERLNIIEQAKSEAEREKAKIIAGAATEIENMVSEAIDKVLVSAKADPLDDFLNKVERGRD